MVYHALMAKAGVVTLNSSSGHATPASRRAACSAQHHQMRRAMDRLLNGFAEVVEAVADECAQKLPSFDANAATDLARRIALAEIFKQLWHARGGMSSCAFESRFKAAAPTLFHLITEQPWRISEPCQQLLTAHAAQLIRSVDGDSCILGRVYEYMLAREPMQHRRNRRKDIGTFYTPQPVVQNLIDSSLSILLQDSATTETAELRIVDPACGAGVFLVAAYRALIERRSLQNQSTAEQRRSAPLLSSTQRIDILRMHIYGVDIDPLAADLCRLTLLLEFCNNRAASDVSDTAIDEVLSILNCNIKCGNSLIGTWNHTSAHDEPVPHESALHAQQFDWAKAFPHIMNKDGGGFDLVIGNPPFRSYAGRYAAHCSDDERAYYRRCYPSHRRGWLTAHGLFIERAVRQLSRRIVAMVVPDQVGHLDGYRHVRQLVADDGALHEVRYWGETVFADAVTPVLTFVRDRMHHSATVIYDRNGQRTIKDVQGGEPWTPRRRNAWSPKPHTEFSSLGKLIADPGVHTGNCAQHLIVPHDCADDVGETVPVLEGRQISRYACAPPRRRLRLDYQPRDGEYFSIRCAERFAAAPFLVRQTAAYPIVGPREHAVYFRNSLLALYPPSDRTDVRYLVAVLNSHVLRALYRQHVCESSQRAFPQVKVRSLRKLPIRTINWDREHDRTSHDDLVQLASRMLELHRQLNDAGSHAARNEIERSIRATDQTIDQIVGRLYGLTPAALTRLLQQQQ